MMAGLQVSNAGSWALPDSCRAMSTRSRHHSLTLMQRNGLSKHITGCHSHFAASTEADDDACCHVVPVLWQAHGAVQACRHLGPSPNNMFAARGATRYVSGGERGYLSPTECSIRGQMHENLQKYQHPARQTALSQIEHCNN